MSDNIQYAPRKTRAAPLQERSRPQPGFADGAAITVIFVILICGTLAAAWVRRDDGLVTPEEGIGYWLGIAGASMLLLLLIYPLRKRMKAMRNWGRVATWFRVHMVLGIVGPTLIVLHSNYQVQSLNAAVALFSMLTVSASGLAGRYLYARIHRGLYGSKLEARELMEEAVVVREAVGIELDGAEWREELAAFERMATAHAPSFFSAWARGAALTERAAQSRRWLSREVERDIRRHAERERWPGYVRQVRLADARDRIVGYYAAVRRAASLAVYERLFAAWHVLHMPLFFLLILTAIIHIVAVHLY